MAAARAPPTAPAVADPYAVLLRLHAPEGGAALRSSVDVARFARALTSQQRAASAQSEGRFDRSVLSVDDSIGLPVLERDEFIKPRTTLEGLASLKVAFGELIQISWRV